MHPPRSAAEFFGLVVKYHRAHTPFFAAPRLDLPSLPAWCQALRPDASDLTYRQLLRQHWLAHVQKIPPAASYRYAQVQSEAFRPPRIRSLDRKLCDHRYIPDARCLSRGAVAGLARQSVLRYSYLTAGDIALDTTK